MKKFLNFLVSFPFMGFLLLVFAFSMAIATFVESSYGTEAAQGLIYKSFWFGFVLALLAFNLLVNFIRHKMYTRQRIAVGLFHISFIIILIGAGITRFISFEGMMHIREGQSSDFILSSEDYLTVKSGNLTVSNPVLFSELTVNEFDEKIAVEGRKVRLKSVGFIKNAVRSVKEDPSGVAMIDFVISQGQGRENYVFSKGSNLNLGNIKLGYELPGANFQFFNRNDSLFLTYDGQIEIRSMTGGETQFVNALDTVPVETMQLYAFDGYMLLVKNYYDHAVATVEKDTSGNEGLDAVVLEVTDGAAKQQVNVMGKHGLRGEPFIATVGNSTLEITYGSDPIYLPFSLQLTDFQMEKYPGSMSPSSYASELVLHDHERSVTRSVRVFMNNTLNYRGYKFFQSSYDQDEGGTVLSVNADQLGTTVTYIGYLLLGLGFVLALFSKTSRFHSLVLRLKQYSKPVGLILLLSLLKVGSASAENSELTPIPRIEQSILDDFSKLWIQGQDGRIEPVSTLSSEILRKITRKSDFSGRSPEEVMLGLYLYPEYWRNVSLVYVTNDQVKGLLGVTESRIPLTSFFDEKGNYKLLEPVKAAFAKMPAFRNVFEKEIINLDERVNVCFMVVNGDAFALFPGITRDVKWSFPGNAPAGLSPDESVFVSKGFEFFRESMSGKGGGVSPGQILASIASYQSKYGSSYLPTDSQKKAELFYNSLNPFKRVFPLYLMVGFVLLIFLFVNIFRQKTMGVKLRMAFNLLIVLGFLLHTFGLALRWYISGHAPWSNGYESMVYVAWASMLAGVIFGRKYPMVIATSAMLSGIILFVAHLNWMNPEITHLVPVLNSYWLMIHVAIITASYGFIGMSAFIGLLVLVMFSVSNPKNSNSIKNTILQLTTISEMSVTVGLYMLTIGTFLGGVWANESWGRYWGWDSKETWALISVVIYSFVAHMRLIPGLKGIYNYTVATVVCFSSILMTYFGVNYYLSGMHSYGRGAIDGMHWSVYVFVVVVTGLLMVSNFKQKHLDFESIK